MRNILNTVPARRRIQPLSVTHPDLAKQAVDWDPSQVSYFKRGLLKWECTEGHQWLSKVIDRVKGKNCPNCNVEVKKIIGILDSRGGLAEKPLVPKDAKQPLTVTHPELSLEAEGWDPSKVSAGSNKKMLWRCKEGHVWEALVSNRSRGRGCRVCSTKQFNERKSASKREKLSNFEGNLDQNLVANANKKQKRKNKQKLNSELTLHQGHFSPGCSICSGKKVLIGFNDLASRYPDLALEADGWDPKEIVYGSGVKKNWKCNLGHNWQASPNLRTQGSDCPFCSHKYLLTGFNDLASTNPELISEVDGWDPTLFIGAKGKNMSWKCQLGHKWKATIESRSKGSGCPSCSKTGFDPNKDGYLYFVIHRSWGMLQIGITNLPKDRLSSHSKLGWELLELRGPMDGHLTQQRETAILRMLKSKGADLSNSKIAGKFDGYSEAWSKSTFEVKSIKELMRLTEEFEGSAS